jgi:hypothetical protein
METPKSVRTFQELVDAYREANARCQVDLERQLLEIDTGASQLAGPLVVRWEKLYPYVQIIQPMIADVPEARYPAVEAAIGRLNNVAMFAGLQLDYPAHLVYFRITTAVLVDGVRLDAIAAYTHGIVHDTMLMLAALKAVVGGEPGENVLTLVKQGKDN